MTRTGVAQATPIRSTLLAIIVFAMVASCGPKPISTTPEGPYAPGVDLSKTAVDGVEVGHRMIDARQYELAIDAFTRAALDQGLTAEILNGMGTANLGLGRLGQAEKLLRRAVEADRFTSLIFYGPPGVVKTSLAELIPTNGIAIYQSLRRRE